MNPIKDLRLVGTLGLAMILNGCEERKAPEPSDFKTSLRIAHPIGEGPIYLYDFDVDGRVDALGIVGTRDFSYVADGYLESAKKIGWVPSDVKIMTPQMIDSASEILQGSTNLGYDIAKQRYEQIHKEDN